jgi:hypothetical protein
VLLGVQFPCLVAVVLRMQVMGMGHVRMMGRFLVVARMMSLCGFTVVFCRMVVVFRRLVVVLQLFFVGHDCLFEVNGPGIGDVHTLGANCCIPASIASGVCKPRLPVPPCALAAMFPHLAKLRTMKSPPAKRVAPRKMHTGSVSTQASRRLRSVLV